MKIKFHVHVVGDSAAGIPSEWFEVELESWNDDSNDITDFIHAAKESLADLYDTYKGRVYTDKELNKLAGEME